MDLMEAEDYVDKVRGWPLSQRGSIPIRPSLHSEIAAAAHSCSERTAHPLIGANIAVRDPAWEGHQRTADLFASVTGKLTDKQEKLKEKLVKRDMTVANLRLEIQRIQAKTNSQDGGLTTGQQVQVRATCCYMSKTRRH